MTAQPGLRPAKTARRWNGCARPGRRLPPPPRRGCRCRPGRPRSKVSDHLPPGRAAAGRPLRPAVRRPPSGCCTTPPKDHPPQSQWSMPLAKPQRPRDREAVGPTARPRHAALLDESEDRVGVLAQDLGLRPVVEQADMETPGPPSRHKASRSTCRVRRSRSGCRRRRPARPPPRPSGAAGEGDRGRPQRNASIGAGGQAPGRAGRPGACSRNQRRQLGDPLPPAQPCRREDIDAAPLPAPIGGGLRGEPGRWRAGAWGGLLRELHGDAVSIRPPLQASTFFPPRQAESYHLDTNEPHRHADCPCRGGCDRLGTSGLSAVLPAPLPPADRP